MIEGLKITITGTELAELCEERSEHHTQRANVYAEQIANLGAAAVEQPANYSGGNPIDSLKLKKAEHVNQAKEMEFIAKHIDTTETYLLGRDDLAKLGIIKSRY